MFKSSNVTIVDLNHYALFNVTGHNAQTFLQGQLTCDVQDITETHHTLGAYCNLQGRVIALFRIFLKENTYYLQLPKMLAENTVKKLKKPALFSKITLENQSEQWQKIGISGKNAPQLLSEILNADIICENNKTEFYDDVILLSLPGIEPRFELIIPLSSNATLLKQLSQKADIKNSEYWKLLDIRAGIPEIWTETTEKLLPHHINLPQLNAVSFTKGCYCGQEIIARMEYRAKIKRHMIQVILSNTQKAPLPGTLLYRKDNQSPEEIGTIIMASPIEEGIEMLIEVLDEHTENWTLNPPISLI